MNVEFMGGGWSWEMRHCWHRYWRLRIEPTIALPPRGLMISWLGVAIFVWPDLTSTEEHIWRTASRALRRKLLAMRGIG